MKTRCLLLPVAALMFAGGAFSFAGSADNPATEMIAILERDFSAWDANHDGVLSTNELDKLVASPEITGEEAALAAALKRASRSAKFILPELTLSNLEVLATNKPASSQPDLRRMFREGMTNLRGATNRQLFSSAPRLENIHQGKIGNCFCLAPLGAMLHRDPAQVKAMFQLQTNGEYLVTLGSHPVRVSPPTDAEIAMTSSNEREGIWVNIYEKAVGEARNEQKPAGQRAPSALDALARGGSAGTMLSFITGHAITRFSFKFAKDAATTPEDFSAKMDDLRQKLASASEQKRLMTCGTLKTTTPGLTPNHAYAVLDYDKAADAVELWNPHGGNFSPFGTPGLKNGYALTNGVFHIPTADFVRQFSGMAFEENRPAQGGTDADPK